MATKSLKQQARDLIDRIHKQNLADIDATSTQKLKQLNENTANAVARTGMNFSSIKPMLDREGEAQISAEATRNRNMENIGYSQNILNWLKMNTGGGSGGGGGTPIPTRGGTPLPSNPLVDVANAAVSGVNAARAYINNLPKAPRPVQPIQSRKADVLDERNYKGVVRYVNSGRSSGGGTKPMMA